MNYRLGKRENHQKGDAEVGNNVCPICRFRYKQSKPSGKPFSTFAKRLWSSIELLERILDALGPAANGDADSAAQGVEASGERFDFGCRLVG